MEIERMEKELKDLLVYRLWQHATKDVGKALEFAHESLKMSEAVYSLKWVSDYLKEVVGEIEKIQESENLLQVFSAPVAVAVSAQKVEWELRDLLVAVLRGREGACARMDVVSQCGNGVDAGVSLPMVTPAPVSLTVKIGSNKKNFALTEREKEALFLVLNDRPPGNKDQLVRLVYPGIVNRHIGVAHGRISRALQGGLLKMRRIIRCGSPHEEDNLFVKQLQGKISKGEDFAVVFEVIAKDIFARYRMPMPNGWKESLPAAPDNAATTKDAESVAIPKNGDKEDMKVVDEPRWLEPLRFALLDSEPSLNLQILMRRTGIKDRKMIETVFKKALSRLQRVLDGREDNNGCQNFMGDFITRWPGKSLDEVVHFLVEQKDGALCFLGVGGGIDEGD